MLAGPKIRNNPLIDLEKFNTGESFLKYLETTKLKILTRDIIFKNMKYFPVTFVSAVTLFRFFSILSETESFVKLEFDFIEEEEDISGSDARRDPTIGAPFATCFVKKPFKLELKYKNFFVKFLKIFIKLPKNHSGFNFNNFPKRGFFCVVGSLEIVRRIEERVSSVALTKACVPRASSEESLSPEFDSIEFAFIEF